MRKELLSAITANTTGEVFKLKPAIGPRNVSLEKVVISGITSATVKIYGGFTSGNVQLVGGGTFTANGSYDCSAFSFMRADVEDYVTGTITVEVGW